MPDWGIAVLLGLFGGVLRMAISREFVRPQRRVGDEGEITYEIGSLGTIVAGGAAGFVAWALTVDELFAGQGFGPKTIAATVLAGLAGADVLLNYVNQTYGTAATQEAGSAVESQAKALENITGELERSKRENRELRRENDRLRGEQ